MQVSRAWDGLRLTMDLTKIGRSFRIDEILWLGLNFIVNAYCNHVARVT
jgi:hypothetical protein